MRRLRLLRAAALAVLAATAPAVVPEAARSATTPVDGQWGQSGGARFLSFDVEGGGR